MEFEEIPIKFNTNMQLFQYKLKKKCNYQIKLTNVSIDFNKTY